MQDRRWGFADPATTPEGAKGVLGSGLAQGGDRTLDFRVRVTAEPGTFWVVSLFAKEAHLRVEVVPDTQEIPSPSEVVAAGRSSTGARPRPSTARFPIVTINIAFRSVVTCRNNI